MNEELTSSANPGEASAPAAGAFPSGNPLSLSADLKCASVKSPLASAKRRFGCGSICAATAGCVVLFLVFAPSIRDVRPAVYRTQCKNNVKQILIALHQYQNAYGAFPPAHTVDRYGRPLHSWRTLILPYLDSPEDQKRYDSIDLSKPWDAPENATVDQSAPKVFRCPANASIPKTHTTYLAVVVPDGWFLPSQPRFETVVEGRKSNSIIVAEVTKDQAVHWMSPADADEALLLGLLKTKSPPHSGGMQVGLDDVSVRYISVNVDPRLFRELMSTTGAVGDF